MGAAVGRQRARRGLSLSELAAQVPGMHAGSATDLRMLGNTLKAMVRAGELVCCGFALLAGRRGRLHWIFAPAPAALDEDAVQAIALLAAAFRAWGRHALADCGDDHAGLANRLVSGPQRRHDASDPHNQPRRWGSTRPAGQAAVSEARK